MTEKPEILNNQAIMYAADGAYTEAIACFKRAILIEKDNSMLWFNLGVTYRDAGELRKAKDALKTACMLAPEDEELLETYGTICLLQKDYLEVLKSAEMGIELNSSNPHFYNLAGVEFFQTKEFEKAAEFFEKAVQLNPYYEDALFNLKDTYSELNNKKGEEECAKRLKELK